MLLDLLLLELIPASGTRMTDLKVDVERPWREVPVVLHRKRACGLLQQRMQHCRIESALAFLCQLQCDVHVDVAYNGMPLAKAE